MLRQKQGTGSLSHPGRTIGRRAFLKGATALLSGLSLTGWPLVPARGAGAPLGEGGGSRNRGKLIFLAVDALHPGYLDLDARGLPGGTDGNWLMPNMRALLGRSVWYRNAKCYLPAATDMNHLNALAGTCSAQTGIISVWAQPMGWDQKKEAIVRPTSMSFARDDGGRPVDTLFAAWKRHWPESRTMLITGKEWVGEMFRQDGTGVDILVTGPNHPDYLKPPQRERMADPATDQDAACDPESTRLGFFGGSLRPSKFMTRLYTGQGGLLTWQMQRFAKHFPHDSWIVDSALEIFKREDPDMAYILLAECDDAGHCIGCAWDPSEFARADSPYGLPKGCEDNPDYQLVSARNKLLFKDAILDVVRDVDIQFGRLMKGLEEQGILERASIVLLSDHSAVNHLSTEDFSSTDAMGLLESEGLAKKNVYAFSVSSYGVLYWHGDKGQVPGAKALLEAHRALNPQTSQRECPWFVLDRDDMKNGVAGVCLPGELYHTYYVDSDREKTMMWPDLILLGKNGWQIPVYNGHVPNVGIKAPKWSPPWRVYNGGHGAVDTMPIVAAVSVPGGRTGVQQRPIRIADLGVTAASLFGLKLNSTTIGADLSDDLV